MKINYSLVIRRFQPYILLAVILGFFSLSPDNTQAQLSKYTFVTGTGSALPSGANIVFQGYRGSRYSGMVSSPINLGFSFKFDGNVYNQIIVYSSGLLTFGSTQITNSNNPTLQNTNVPVVAAFWGGQSQYTGRQSVSLTGAVGGACGVTPDVEYQVSGSTGNHVMVVGWNFVDITSTECLSTWQIRLYEATNAVEIYYQHMTTMNDLCPNAWWNGNNIPTYAGIGVANGATNFISVTPTGSSNANTSNTVASNAINLQANPIGDGTVYKFIIPENVQLSVAPKTLPFGLVAAGTNSTSLCTTVKSVGTSLSTQLTISSATIVGNSDFTITSSPASNTYANGASGQYCVTFKPSTGGVRTGTLRIVSNGRDSGVQQVLLTGVGGEAEISVDSTVKFKKTRTRLGDSLTQYVHISSIGQEPLFMNSFTFVGQDAGQFHISYFPTNPIPVGVTDSVGITYAPTLEGRHTADLIMTSNAFTKPSIDISLIATGILPHIVVTPALLLFDSTREGDTVCKNITIFNPGSDTLKLLNNSLTSNDGDFHYTGLTGSDANIPPDQSKTVTVCFTPLQQGTRQARLTLFTNIIKTFETPRRDTAGLIIVDIHGTGVPFGVFANSVAGLPFTDSAVIGVTVCRTDTLKNNGDADILVNGLTIAGTGGTHNSVFTYSGLPAFPFTLKARTSVVFTVCGTPDKQGLLNGTATVTGKTGGTNISDVLSLAVYGFKPCISPSPLSLFNGVVLPNNGSDSTICDTITNCGDIPATYSVAISGASQADYSVSPATSGVVPAHGGTAIFCVKYKPSVVGPSLASLDVSTADNSESAKIPLNGSDGCATLTNVPPVVPNTGENETNQFTFTITNTGTTPWLPGQPSISGAGAGSYHVVSIIPQPSPPGKDGDPIPAGGQAIVTVTFHPPLGSVGQTLTANISWPGGSPCQTSVLGVDVNGQSIVSSVTPTTVDGGFVLAQSYPNPTTGNTSFSYSIPSESLVEITLVDMTGKLVRTLITGRVSEGMHTVNFDVSNLSSGTYIYILQSGSTRLSRQLVLTR